MKYILFSVIFIVLVTSYIAKAEDSVLIVPAQYWSDGNHYPTKYKYFPDTLYMPYEGHIQCMMVSKTLHANLDKPAPSYSMCTNPKSFDRRLWN
jgi:hypothetical protein